MLKVEGLSIGQAPHCRHNGCLESYHQFSGQKSAIGYFYAQSVLTEPVLPQSAQLDIYSYNLYYQRKALSGP